MWTICRSYANRMWTICILYVDRMWLMCESYANYMWILVSSSSIFLSFPPFFMWLSFSLNCFMKLIGLIDKNWLWSPPPLPTVKTVCEVSTIHIRCAYNIHMICILITYDSHMIRIWFAYDQHTIHIPWCAYNMLCAYYLHTFICKLYVIRIWFTYIRVQFMLVLNTIFHTWVC